MSFLHPALAIAGVVAASIPIIIHLFLRWRMPQLPWGAMRFIQAAMEQRRRRLQIQTWVLLLIRCALALLIGLALAQPRSSVNGLLGSERRLVALIVDAGAMGQLEGRDGSTIDRLAKAGREIIGALATADRVMLVRADEPGRIVVEPTRDHSIVREALLALDAGARPIDLSAALRTAVDSIERARDEGEQRAVVLLTSGLAGSFADAGETAVPDDLLLCALGSPADAPPNVQIEDLTIDRGLVLRRSGLPVIATTTLVRTGANVSSGESEIRWYTLDEDGQETAINTSRVQWSEGERRGESSIVIADALIQEKTGAIAVRTDRDALRVDNERYASVLSRDVLEIIVFDQESDREHGRINAADWISFALSPREGGAMRVARREVGTIRGQDVQADVIIVPDAALISVGVWSELLEYRARGGNVVVFPPRDEAVTTWSAPLDAEAVTVSFGSLVAWSINHLDYHWIGDRARDVSRLAGEVAVKRLWSLTGSGVGAASTLIRIETGEPILYQLEATGGAGALIVSTLPLDLEWSTLPARPVMPPLVHELMHGLCDAGLVPDVPEITALRDTSGTTDAVGWPVDGASLLNPNVAGCSTDAIEVRDRLEAITRGQPWTVGTAKDLVSTLTSTHAPGRLGQRILVLVLILSLVELYCARRWSYAGSAGRSGGSA